MKRGSMVITEICKKIPQKTKSIFCHTEKDDNCPCFKPLLQGAIDDTPVFF